MEWWSNGGLTCQVSVGLCGGDLEGFDGVLEFPNRFPACVTQSGRALGISLRSRWSDACLRKTYEGAGRNACPMMYLIPNFLFFAEGLLLVKNKLKFQQAQYNFWQKCVMGFLRFGFQFLFPNSYEGNLIMD